MSLASSAAHPLSFPGAFMNPFRSRIESPGAHCAEGRMQADQAATTLTLLALGSSSSSKYTVGDRSARSTYQPLAYHNGLEGSSTTPSLPSIAQLGLDQLPPIHPERRSSVASVASSVSSVSSSASGCSTVSSSVGALSDSAVSRSSSVSTLSSLLSPSPSSPTRHSSPAWNLSNLNHTLLPHPREEGVRRRGGSAGAVRGVSKPGAKTANRNNQKYPDTHVDFVLYGRCTRNLPWAPLTAEYEQWQRRVAASGGGGGGGGRLPSRTPSGLQARYYRQRLVVPVVDTDGGITFDAAGKQMFREQKVRDDKCIDIKVDLIHMFPERVVHYAYDFVTPNEMERAKRLTLRNFQRRQRGLPEWEPETDQRRRRIRNPSRRNAPLRP